MGTSRNKCLVLGALVLFCGVIGVSRAQQMTTATTQLTTATMNLNVAFEFKPEQVTDPKARAAVEQIQRLDSNINEYTVAVETDITTFNGNTMKYRTDVSFRRPDFYREKKTTLYFDIPGVAGQVHWNVNDGEWIWQYTEPSPGAKDQALRSYRGQLTQEKLDLLNNVIFATNAHRYSVKRLNEAGVPISEVMENWNVHEPLVGLDPAKFKLISQVPESWELLGRPKPGSPEDFRERVIINKRNGALLTTALTGKISMNLKTINLKINPDPPLEDSVFQFKMPKDITFPDETEDYIKKRGTPAPKL